MRDGYIRFNSLRDLETIEKFHAPDTHREFLTTEEFKRFLEVKTDTVAE